MNSAFPGFVVLYRWRLRQGSEQKFVAAWSRISERLRSEHDSLGSRLHRGTDGLWYSYAQWPSARVRERALASGSVDPAATRQMSEAIAETLPEVILESVADYLIVTPRSVT